MPTSETRVLTAHVPVPLAEKIDHAAQQLDRSRGWIVRDALTAWIAQEEARDQLTREALADVAAGRTVEDRQVIDWAESLDTKHPRPLPR